MNKRSYSFVLRCLFFALISGQVYGGQTVYREPAAHATVISLGWEDLIPKDEQPPVVLPDETPVNHEDDTPPQTKGGGVRHDLSGKLVKLPGFVIPLEGNDKVVTEFLLVPFLGACIHVPPPPPNQIVYVKFKDGAPTRKLWDIVNVIGYLKTETVNADLGEAAYVLYGNDLEDYQPES